MCCLITERMSRMNRVTLPSFRVSSSLHVVFLVIAVRCILAVQSVEPPFIQSLLHMERVGSERDGPETTVSDKVVWINQTLDHFSTMDGRVFRQRYFENLEHFKSADGPIFLRICGEATCGGTGGDYLTVLAKHFGAAIVALEHRYYGESYPFSDLSTDNMKYLSSKQALADLAAFRQHYQALINERFGRNGRAENAWITVGVSYAGALSAWFRLKYPHLTRGSIASSGVVHAILEFASFDKQVASSAGKECASALRAVTKLAEEGLETNAKATKQLFEAEEMSNDGDFLYLLADATVLPIQYGHPDVLCKPMVAAYLTGQDLLGTFASYIKDFLYGKFGITPRMYSREGLNDTTPGPDSGYRQWWYQTCTEVGYLQVAPRHGSIRSRQVNLKYHRDLCSSLFGPRAFPDVPFTNLYYGGKNIKGTRIFFTNGSQDPWRHASKVSSSPGEPTMTMRCHNCGHGADFRGCPQAGGSLPFGNASKCERPNEVLKARRRMQDLVASWIDDEDFNQILEL